LRTAATSLQGALVEFKDYSKKAFVDPDRLQHSWSMDWNTESL
jgi:hypothetical protein